MILSHFESFLAIFCGFYDILAKPPCRSSSVDKNSNPSSNPSSNQSSKYHKMLPKIPQRIQSLQPTSRHQTPNQTRQSTQIVNKSENPNFQLQIFPTFISEHNSSPNHSLNISRSSSSATTSSEDSTKEFCRKLQSGFAKM